MNKDINDLRDRLFATLDGLSDKQNPLEIDRAKAIADVARVIIDSARAETKLLETMGARGAATKFIPVPATTPDAGPRRLPGATAGGICPSCGGRLRPETNGGGAVVDVCADCGRTPRPVLQAAK